MSLNIYHVKVTTKDGDLKDDLKTSFNAFDAAEEWFYENESEVDNVQRLTVEFVRNAQ